MFILDMLNHKLKLPNKENALPGRDEALDCGEAHYINRHPLRGPYPDNMQKAVFGLGCFWGAERKFWELEGVHITAVGYISGQTLNPTYNEVCTGRTGHNEVVLVIYDPAVVSFERLLKLFWEIHDPTQGMRQGNDVGTQYRSGIYVFNKAQNVEATVSREAYQNALHDAGHTSKITTEIIDAPEFYFAEEYHQQYLAKNPSGYCNIGGTGVACPIGTGVTSGVPAE